MKQFFFLFCLGLSLHLFAQTGSVHQVSKDGILKGAKSFATQDGGFIIVTKDLKTVPFSITAIKYAASGATQWRTTVTNGTSSWELDFPFIVQVKDGSYVIALLEAGTIDIIRLSRQGAYLWDKTFRRKGDPNSFSTPSFSNISGIVADNTDSAVVICGRYSTYSKLKGYIFKLNIVTGKPVWVKTAYSNVLVNGFKNQQDYFSAIDNTSDGNYIVGDVATVIKGFNYDQYFAFYKYDRNGNVLWAKAAAPNGPSDVGSTVLYDIKETQRGNYLVIGANDFGYNSYLKLNDTGKILYTKRLHISPGDTTQFTLSRITLNKANGLTYISGNNPNYFNKVKLFAITDTGALYGAGSFAFDSTDFKNNESLLTLSNNSTLATGYSQAGYDDVTNKLYYINISAKGQNCLLKNDNSFTSTDLPVVQQSIQEAHTDETAAIDITSSSYKVISASFTDVAICGGTTLEATNNEAAATVAAIAKTANKLSVQVLPNPVKGSVLQVQFNASAAGQFYFSVADMNGRVLYNQQKYFSPGLSTMAIPVQNLQSGIYVFAVSNRLEKQTVKFIKE